MAQIDFLGDPIFQAIDANGVPVQGGLVWCYDAGTDDLRDMYATITDAINQTNPTANPVILDSTGRASIVYAGPSRFVLENSDIDPDTGHGTVIWTADNVGRFGNTIIDPNGNIIVEYSYVSDPYNYIEIVNSVSGGYPKLEAKGDDNVIGIELRLKNNDSLIVSSDSYSYSFPTEDGPSGYIMTSNGDNTISWAAPPGISDIIPPGFMMDFAGTVAPAGWLLCNGSNVSRAVFSDLFAAIGTTWGVGDGVNTFTLPDLTGRTRVGAGGSLTTMGNSVGNTGGAETITLTSAQIPAHTHPGSSSSSGAHTHTIPHAVVTNAASGAGVNGLTAGVTTTSSNGAHTHTITVSNNVGGGGAHNNMQPSAVVLTCIKI